VLSWHTHTVYKSKGFGGPTPPSLLSHNAFAFAFRRVGDSATWRFGDSAKGNGSRALDFFPCSVKVSGGFVSFLVTLRLVSLLVSHWLISLV
jgi:hypothetical protein